MGDILSFLRAFGLPWTLSVLVFVSPSSIGRDLSTLLTFETIGLQKAYLDKSYGPAKRKIDQSTFEYEVNKCQVFIEFDKSKSVSTVELVGITSKCTFNTGRIGLEGPAHKLTYEKLTSFSFRWRAQLSCYESCGNAYDPSYGVLVELPRSAQFLQIDASTNYNKSSKQANLVFEEAKALFPKAEMTGCEMTNTLGESEYNKLWIRQFKHTLIDSLKFGYELRDRNCPSGSPSATF